MKDKRVETSGSLRKDFDEISRILEEKLKDRVSEEIGHYRKSYSHPIIIDQNTRDENV